MQGENEMQSIKYCMLFFVFISSVLIGKCISKQYIYRLEELEEIKNALNIFKSKIKFTYDPIPIIFEEISKNANKNISKLFLLAKEKMKNNVASVSWEQAVDEVQCNLKEEDKQKVKTLSKLLRNNRCRRSIKSN
jgi:stage III sporulation protein AB